MRTMFLLVKQINFSNALFLHLYDGVGIPPVSTGRTVVVTPIH